MSGNLTKENLIEVIDRLTPHMHRMLTPGFFAERLGVEETSDLNELLHQVSKEDVRLERWAMLFEMEDEYDIEEEDLAHFDATGELVHPHSGVLIPNAENHLSIYYAIRPPQHDMPAPD